MTNHVYEFRPLESNRHFDFSDGSSLSIPKGACGIAYTSFKKGSTIFVYLRSTDKRKPGLGELKFGISIEGELEAVVEKLCATP